MAKTFKFKTFRDALAWMVRAGFEAEALEPPSGLDECL